MSLIKKIADQKYLDDEHSKIQEILNSLAKFGINNFINPSKYFNFQQFLDINQSLINVENDESYNPPMGYLTRTNYAYIYVPAAEESDPSNYSFIMLHILKYFQSVKPIGWIFDFRGNSGGVIHSFILGFLPILDSFMISATDKNDNKKMELIYDRETIYFKYLDTNIVDIFGTFPPSDLINIDNVNILVDKETASCGELLTYLLKKQKNATIYGDLTYGIPTWKDYSIIYKKGNYEIMLQYPELLLNFSDSVKIVNQFQKFKIVPDVIQIPFSKFGIF